MFRQGWRRIRTATHRHRDPKQQQQRRRVAIVLGVSAAATTSVVVVSYKTRQWRKQHLHDLPSWQQLYTSPQHVARQTPQELKLTMTRAKLTAPPPRNTSQSSKGISQQLDDIRTWHIQHGYKGGLVVRELNKPLFTTATATTTTTHSHTDKDNNDDDTDATQQYNPHFELYDAMALARRECYYLYYEVMGDGHVHQEIYCRGTTLWVDILTCLQFWWTYDEDLDCLVHGGFLNHAQHLLQDVLPLLAPPTDSRATIEISGHSLGGAVAFLLAIKLKLLGYNVVKLTAIGAPRFLFGSPVLSSSSFGSTGTNNKNVVQQRLLNLLPPDTLRIEDDLDIVPYLPPFANTLGDKLWMVDANADRRLAAAESSSLCLFVPFGDFPWTESTWINFRFLDVLTSFAKHHRVSSYMEQLEKTTANNQGQGEEGSTSKGDNESA